MRQQNTVVVDALGITQPLLLSVELQPSFVEKPILQKPVAIDGTPVAERLREIAGFQIVQRVDTELHGIRFTFPASLFDPDLYGERSEIDGWQMRVVLATQIDAYPVTGAKRLGDRYVIRASHLAARPTLIVGVSPGQLPEELLGFEYITVPQATYGLFCYFVPENVMDSITMSSGLSFHFVPSDRQP